MAEKQMTGDFMVDYEEDSKTTVITAFRGDRSIAVEIRPIMDTKEQDQATGHETTVLYGVYGPSLTRRHEGYTGEAAKDTVERGVSDAKVEDLITALLWLVGRGEMAANAEERPGVAGPTDN
jgi:hypothetical protein